jgi:hypothetical protein
VACAAQNADSLFGMHAHFPSSSQFIKSLLLVEHCNLPQGHRRLYLLLQRYESDHFLDVFFRGSCATDCPINTVLWNTIQLLFPRETADRIKEQKSRELEKKKLTDAIGKPTVKNLQHPTGFVRRTLRPVPWRQLPTSNTNNLDGARPISSNGSFQRASTILRSLQTAAHVVEPTNGLFGSRVQQQRGGSGNTWQRRQGAAAISRQEQEDAALAARLQESFI